MPKKERKTLYNDDPKSTVKYWNGHAQAYTFTQILLLEHIYGVTKLQNLKKWQAKSNDRTFMPFIYI